MLGLLGSKTGLQRPSLVSQASDSVHQSLQIKVGTQKLSTFNEWEIVALLTC